VDSCALCLLDHPGYLRDGGEPPRDVEADTMLNGTLLCRRHLAGYLPGDDVPEHDLGTDEYGNAMYVPGSSERGRPDESPESLRLPGPAQGQPPA